MRTSEPRFVVSSCQLTEGLTIEAEIIFRQQKWQLFLWARTYGPDCKLQHERRALIGSPDDAEPLALALRAAADAIAEHPVLMQGGADDTVAR